MQKDWILPSINSVKLNPTGANVPVHVDIQSVVINGVKMESGWISGYWNRGYDEGSDGEILSERWCSRSSEILYLKHRGKGKLAASLIPQVRDEKEQKQ